jgi:glyoxylase I family protein
VANFPAITHVALTVTDLDRSAVWYERLLGVEPVLDEDAGGFYHKVYPLSGGMLLGLHLHPGGDNGEQFSVTRPGLDHVAFGCASRDELTEWQARLEELGIAHDGIIDAAYGSGLSFKDPDGTALEFFAPPA